MKRLKILIIPLLIVALLGFGMNSFASLHSKWSAGDLIFYDGATDIFTIKDSTDGLMVHDDINLTFGDGSDATIEWDADGTSKLILTCSSGFTLAGDLGFTGDILMATTSKIQFHDTGLYINASGNGALVISSDGTLAVGATTSYTLTSPAVKFIAQTSVIHEYDSGDYVTQTVADGGAVKVAVTGAVSGTYEIETSGGAIVLDAAAGITLDAGTGIVTTAQVLDVTNTTDASAIGTAAIISDGGISCADELWLGDDLDMSSSADGVYDITLRTNVADALSITDGTDIIVFKTSATRMITITPAVTFSGAIICDDTTASTSGATGSIQTDGGLGVALDAFIVGDLTLGIDGTGSDVTFYGDIANSSCMWDESANTLKLFTTYTADAQIETYDARIDATTTYNTAITTGKFAQGIYIGIAGSGNVDSGGYLFPLWIDSSGTGTNNGTYYMTRYSVQSGGLLPNAYIQFQTASPGVTYLFKIAGDVAPYYGDAATYSTADGYLLINTPDGDRRIAVYAGSD